MKRMEVKKRNCRTNASSGPPMLVTGLAKQAPRPKRIGPLTLPLASFGGTLKRGVRILMQIIKPTRKGHAIAAARLFQMVRLSAKSTPLRNYKWRAENVMLFAPADCGSRPCLGFTIAW